MDSPSYISLSRLVAQQRATAVTANNIANMETPGFRAGRPVFGTVLERQQGADAPNGGQEMAFAQDRATWRAPNPGAMASTGNPLDVAIAAPEGYFVLETPAGERFTRAGRFTLDAEGRITDSDGNALLGTNGAPLRLAPGESRITILGDGTLRTENGDNGTLRIVRFPNPQRLVPEGDRLMAAPDDMRPEPLDRPGLIQGTVEGSNVNAISEITRMTEEMREFQFVSQMVEREGERMGSAVDRILRRR